MFRKAKLLFAFLLLPIVCTTTTLSGKQEPPARNFVLVNHEYQGTKQWLPGTIIAKKGDRVTIKLINKVPSGTHGFRIADFNIKASVKKNGVETVSFIADKVGVFSIDCHLHAAHVGGQLYVIE